MANDPLKWSENGSMEAMKNDPKRGPTVNGDLTHVEEETSRQAEVEVVCKQ